MWVAVDFLLSVPSEGKEAAWSGSFRDMLDAARRFGWVRDEQRLEVKAHVIWAKQQGNR